MSWLFPGGTTIVGSPVTVGTTTVLPPGSNATVTNSGTAYAPVLNFGIPSVANVQDTIVGAATTIVLSNLAPSIVVVSNPAGKVANSSTTVTELGYVSGVTSAIQTQFSRKANVTVPFSASDSGNVVSVDAQGNLIVSGASAINGNVSSKNVTATGNVTAGNLLINGTVYGIAGTGAANLTSANIAGPVTAGAIIGSSLNAGSGSVTTTGNVLAGDGIFSGNLVAKTGSANVASANVSGVLTAGATTVSSLSAGSGSIQTTGNVLAGDGIFGGNVVAANLLISGTVYGIAGTGAANLTSANIAGILTAGNVIAGDVISSGNVVTNNSGRVSSKYINPTTQLASRAVCLDSTGNVATANSLVFVRTLADFPAPTSGNILLAGSCQYRILANVDLLGNALVCGTGTSIVGTPYCTAITSTGISSTTPLLTANANVAIDSVMFSAPTVLNVVLSNVALATIWRSLFTGTTAIGNVGGGAGLNVLSSSFVAAGTNATGINLYGNMTNMTLRTCKFVGTANNTTLTLDANAIVTNRLSLTDCDFNPGAGGNAISIPASANLGIQSFWIQNCIFETGTAIVGANPITSSTVRSFQNLGMYSSVSSGQIYLTGYSNVSTSNTSVFYKLTGPYAAGSNNSTFTTDGAGRLTYVGAVPQKFLVNASVSFTTANNNDAVAFGIYDSSLGNVASASVQSMTAGTATQPQNLGLVYLTSLVSGQYLEVWGQDQTTTNGTIRLRTVSLAVLEI